MTHKTNKGIDESYRRLHKEAGGTHFYQTAADGQWPAENLESLLYTLLKEKAFVVIGVRQDREKVYNWYRRLLSYGFNRIPEIFYGVKTKDANGIKLGHREYFSIHVRSESFFSEIERIIEANRMGKVIAYAPVQFLQRREGKEKGARFSNVVATFKDFFRYARKNKPNLFKFKLKNI